MKKLFKGIMYMLFCRVYYIAIDSSAGGRWSVFTLYHWEHPVWSLLEYVNELKSEGCTEITVTEFKRVA